MFSPAFPCFQLLDLFWGLPYRVPNCEFQNVPKRESRRHGRFPIHFLFNFTSHRRSFVSVGDTSGNIRQQQNFSGSSLKHYIETLLLPSIQNEGDITPSTCCVFCWLLAIWLTWKNGSYGQVINTWILYIYIYIHYLFFGRERDREMD